MTVIAMTREMGTLGKDVAAGLAETLGLESTDLTGLEKSPKEALRRLEKAVAGLE